MRVDSKTPAEKWFEDLKKEVMKIDPVSFAENYLTLDGKPLKLTGTGWRFLSDIYRYIALEAIKPTGKPVVCTKGRQVGATTMATALELYFATSGLFGNGPENPPIRILHCFPALALVQRFAKDRLSTMMRTSKDNYVLKQSLTSDEKTGKKRQDVPDDTLTEKQFKNENKLWVDSNANDAARLHGMTLDVIFYDEVQRMNQDDIGNSKRTLTAARYGPKNQGIQLYFGTPLQKGSYFYKMWEASDQRYYHLKCVNCSHYFLLYTPGSDDWEKTWLYGNIVECPSCKHHQQKEEAVEEGKWIATKTRLDNGQEPLYVGFHFNQLLIPGFTKEIILKEKPGIHPTNSDRIWKNEILGEFYSGSDLPMSEEDIHKYCRNLNKKISYGIIQSDELNTFMGVDWGGKVDNPEILTGKSFSTVVVISVNKEGIINIENAFKLKKNDLEHKKDVVAEMFRRFGIKLAIADLGFGNDIVPEIQKEFGSRFLGCMSSGSLVNPYKYDPEDLRLICNPHVVLEELFANMRKSKVLFPWQSYEQLEWLVQHCTSMEKKITTVAGQVITRYVKGSSANDGLQSLMYAYLGYKYMTTRGFTLKPHQVNSKGNSPILLAHLPGM